MPRFLGNPQAYPIPAIPPGLPDRWNELATVSHHMGSRKATNEPRRFLTQISISKALP